MNKFVDQNNQIDQDVAELFGQNLVTFFRSTLLRCRINPGLTLALFRILRDQKRGVRLRSALAKQGLTVPPLMIVSITNACNLNCKGCYARAIHAEEETVMSDSRLAELIGEANDLGVSIIMIAGGEPLLRPIFFDLARQYPHILFPVFTNGLLINPASISRFKKQRNLVPILSLEGHQMETDMRRGSGVYAMVQKKMDWLRKEGILFGTSLTLTRTNFDLITSVAFQKDLSKLGSQVSIFVDYVPVQPGTETYTLTPEQKGLESTWTKQLYAELPGVFVSLPGDESLYGGCLAGGRGFIHVNPSGRVEPCPFAPFSDTDLNKMSLREALDSSFLSIIRENAGKLGESAGGCTLWENREWVLEQLDKE